MATTSPSRPDSHYVRWDEPGDTRCPAICGKWLRRYDHANDPTCPRCRALLLAREEQES